jgi:hypothetical protein
MDDRPAEKLEARKRRIRYLFTSSFVRYPSSAIRQPGHIARMMHDGMTDDG